MHRMMLACFLVLSGLLLPGLAFAHGGGLNKEGCHNDNQRGEYHCHRRAPSSPVTEQPAARTSLERSASPHRIKSFRDAKQVLQAEIYREPAMHFAFYSGCRYHAQGKKLVPEWSSCGFRPRKNANRASRIEWEHVVPAWAIGHQRQCWQQGGRRNCTRVDPLFAMAEADMHNLVPTIGEINGDRSNYRFGELGQGEAQYGAVQFRVDFKQRAVEPPAGRKGDIARIYFYMSDTYGLALSSSQRRLFEVWHRQDPVDPGECERVRRIERVQGNGNPFVSNDCV